MAQDKKTQPSIRKAAQKTSGNDVAVLALTQLMRIQKQLRWAGLEDLRFILVNETKSLLPFQQAVLWEAEPKKITAISSVSKIDPQSPYTQFMQDLTQYLAKNFSFEKSGQSLSASKIKDQKLTADWPQFLADHLWVQPLYDLQENLLGFYMIARSQKWQEAEQQIIQEIGDSVAAALYQHQLQAQERLKQQSVFHQALKPKLWAIILLIIAAFPMRLSTLAPAEIIAQDPNLIRAPIEGIIAEIAVKPNQIVKAGDTLITFDMREMLARKEVAQASLTASQAALRQASQEALNDATARLKLAQLQSQIKQDQSDIAFITDMMTRSEIKAEQDGIVIFEDHYDWVGRPVTIGEKIMLLANPAKTEVEMQLPTDQLMKFPKKADILFFSNMTPHAPDAAKLSFTSYRATKTQQNEMAYRLKGTWENSDKQYRLGLKGTAKIYAYYRPFIWHLIRRPIFMLRQMIGV